MLASLDQIEALVPAWEGLLARSSCHVPFLTPQWLLPWWRVFGPIGGREPGKGEQDEARTIKRYVAPDRI